MTDERTVIPETEDKAQEAEPERRTEVFSDGAPDEDLMYDLAELFRIFGDSTRIKILYALLNAEMCVGDIADLLKISQSAVSHQLRVLKQTKLVRFRRDGKTIYYTLADDHVRTIIGMGIDHLTE